MSVTLDDTLRMHSTALGVRAHRQQVLASNIANADTPSFKARDVDFAAVLDAAGGGASAPLRLMKTSAGHVEGAAGADGNAPLKYRVPVQASVDGNTVEMDVERANFAENALHYEAILTLLGMEIKTRLAAIQG